ncbi:alpha/beta hydrolase [Pararoseomonas baculiformis]|nr:alpha/beta hydrolase [Pararoseomonas baculiformis]
MLDQLAPNVLAAQAEVRDAGFVQGDAMTQPIAEARAQTRRFQTFLSGEPVPLAGVEEVVIADGLRLRIYRPDAPGPLPALLHIHGGGFAFGDIDSLDRWKREIARDAAMIVVGLEYALAPENPYPAAVNQVLAALRWMRDEGAAHGMDGGRLAVSGDSAGGNLALNALIRLRDAGEAGPSFGAIIYGMLSAEHDAASHAALGTGRFGLSTARLDWFWTQYLGTTPRDDTGAAPLRADLRGLPPLLLLAAALDPLLDDTLKLDARLDEAGVPREMQIFEGVPHGFIAWTRLLPQAQAARAALVEALRRHLG